MVEKVLKKLIGLALAAVILLTAGCGNSNGKDFSKEENGSNNSDIAMGRYAEEEIDLSESLVNTREIKKLSDGRLMIADTSSGIWVSDDNGSSWKSENTKWLEEKLKNAYIMDITVLEDGTLGIIYDDYEEVPEESDSAFNLSPECALVKADGTVIPVSLSLTEDEMYANRMWMTKEGRTFVTTLGNIIYEVKEDGSSEEFLTMEGRPMLIQFWENIMLIDGYDFEAPLLYDI